MSGARGPSTPAALPPVATASRFDPESARMTAEDLILRSGIAAQIPSTPVEVSNTT